MFKSKHQIMKICVLKRMHLLRAASQCRNPFCGKRVVCVEEELLQRDQVLKLLKGHIKEVQIQMKKSYDSKHGEEEYQEGAWVYVRLQPYRQISVSIRHAKIAPRYYGPFHIRKHIG